MQTLYKAIINIYTYVVLYFPLIITTFLLNYILTHNNIKDILPQYCSSQHNYLKLIFIHSDFLIFIKFSNILKTQKCMYNF